jgi:hypothetical protein
LDETSARVNDVRATEFFSRTAELVSTPEPFSVMVKLDMVYGPLPVTVDKAVVVMTGAAVSRVMVSLLPLIVPVFPAWSSVSMTLTVFSPSPLARLPLMVRVMSEPFRSLLTGRVRRPVVSLNPMDVIVAAPAFTPLIALN